MQGFDDVEPFDEDVDNDRKRCCQDHSQRPEQYAESKQRKKKNDAGKIDRILLDQRGQHITFQLLDNKIKQQHAEREVGADGKR